MRPVAVGDIVGDGYVVVDPDESGAIIANRVSGMYTRYEYIYGYEEHDRLLATPTHVFCIDCDAESFVEDGADYPYVKMLKGLPKFCHGSRKI